VSERVEAKLFDAFAAVAGLSALGHKRLDVRREQNWNVIVIRVLRGKRDVGRFLRWSATRV